MKAVKTGVVFNLMCERKTEIGLVKEWEKKVFVQAEDLPVFINKYNMKTRGGLLYISEFVQKNQRRPKGTEPWVATAHETQPLNTMERIKRHRRTKAEITAAKKAQETGQPTVHPLQKPKRPRRTKAEMQAFREQQARIARTTRTRRSKPRPSTEKAAHAS